MKHFLIRYRFTNGTEEDWHQDIAGFISALDKDPELKGKISYRCMKIGGSSDYYHLAAAADDQAVKALQQRDFFKRYTEKTKVVAGGEVVVSPLEIIAETKQRA
ncbi:MAG: hypothetical protein ACHQAY_10130 [Hyphomicrobiales bacterium]